MQTASIPSSALRLLPAADTGLPMAERMRNFLPFHRLQRMLARIR
jgi:hypothetical protein